MTRRPTAQVPALVLALAVGFAAAAFATPALAQEPDRGMGWGYHLANELMSPYCPGRTLNDCPSSQAAELKSWILAQEQAGRSQAEVETDLYARYGDVILQAPRAEGFGLAAYVLPVLAVLAGAALIVAFLRRQGPRPPPGAVPPGLSPSPDARSGALEAELEAELAGRR